MSNNKLRSFVGMPVPEPMLQQLSSIAAGMAALDSARMSWVSEENYHLTLLFLGEQSPTWLDEFAQALFDELSLDEQYLSVSRIMPFPENSPRLVAAMIEETDSLKQLHHDVKKIAKGLGFKPEKRRFTPHITLARKYPKQVGQIIPTVFDKVDAYAHELIIYESQLRQDGAQYFPLYGFEAQRMDAGMLNEG